MTPLLMKISKKTRFLSDHDIHPTQYPQSKNERIETTLNVVFYIMSN